MKEFHEKRVTEPARQEFIIFTKWLNEHVGHEPVIIGGWAAHAYVHGAGSKDIDIVFPGNEAKHNLLLAYFHTHGYSFI